MEFDALLRQSDILTLHCPLSEKTRGLMNLDAFGKMKRTAVLVNVARGAVVKEEDLYTALKENLIMAAGTDVLCQEPLALDHPLLRIQDSTKLLITPHMAWAGIEARTRLVTETCLNIESFLSGGMRNALNP